MNNNEQFASKLIELTKENKIAWKYLEDNPTIYNNLKIDPYDKGKIVIREAFDTDSSFFTVINSNFIVLYKIIVSTNTVLDSLRLKTIPNTFKDIQNIDLKENKELLLRLLNAVKSQFPNSEDIINDILNM